MIKFRQYEFSRTDKWGFDDKKLPEGAVRHTSSKYSKRCAMWLVPESKYKVKMSKFIIDRSSKDFINDRGYLETDEDKKRYDMILDDLKKGYVFEDNPKNNWTNTHYLENHSTGDLLAFSKDVNSLIRTTYFVGRPKKDSSGNWYCPVIMDRCTNHRSGGTRYNVSKRSLGNNAKITGDSEIIKRMSEK